MASASESLSEPAVLAHTKRHLFPDNGEENTYAVVDTQFAQTSWLSEVDINAEIKQILAPFNHVQVGSGYPDLVGVRNFDSELLSAEERSDDPPLVVVEAKGYTETETVDVERGIVQAHDRLHEANAAFVAAPISAISQSHQTLARELNIGILGVDVEGRVESLEVPRIVGNQTAGEATSIRFQASAQGVANRSFSLNHPKNYLAYPLALYHPDDTESVLSEYVVDAIDGARSGASFLNLVDVSPTQERLTPLGKEVVRFAHREYDSVDAALHVFDEWKGSPKRFCDIASEWGLLTRRIIYDYPATQLLVEELQRLHNNGVSEPSLPKFIHHLHERHPSFTVELFLRGDENVRERVLSADGDLQHGELFEGNVYHSPTVFQLKAMLYHAGIVSERGKEPSRLEPSEDVWALRERL